MTYEDEIKKHIDNYNPKSLKIFKDAIAGLNCTNCKHNIKCLNIITHVNGTQKEISYCSRWDGKK